MQNNNKKQQLCMLIAASFLFTNLAFAQPAYANGFTDTVASYWDSFTSWVSGFWSDDSSSGSVAESYYADESSTESVAGSATDSESLVQEIESNNGVLPANAHIKAKKKQSDGSWRVAISYEGENNKKVDIVVNLNEAGVFSPLRLAEDEMQKEYDALLSGNEMSSAEVQEADTVMHDISLLSKTLKEDYGLSGKTLAATAAGATALGGLYLAGVGAKAKRKEELEEAVEKEVATNGVSRYYAPVDMNTVYNSLAKMPNTSSDCDPAMYSAVANCISSTTNLWQGESLQKLASYIITTANKYNLNPLVITAQLKQESGFNPLAGSSAGACGIAQFIPSTAASFGIDPWDVEQAIEGQCKYMSSLMSNFNNDYTLALAGYNAGGGAVERYGGIPPYSETQHYVKNIAAMVDNMADDYKNA